MELRKFIEFYFFFFALLCLKLSEGIQRKTISSDSNINIVNKPDDDTIEGSGSSPMMNNDKQSKGTTPVDTEFEGSGISPDDEDGDVIEGSGVPARDHEVEGSGNGYGVRPPISRVMETNLLDVAKSTSLYPSFNEAESNNEHVFVEQNIGEDGNRLAATALSSSSSSSSSLATPTTTKRYLLITSSSKRPFTTIQSPPSAPPTAFEEKRNILFDASLKPGVLAALIGGTVIGILATILLVMFVVYRMRKKDEGSYALDEPKQQQPPNYSYAYQKAPTKEFYA